MAPDDLAARQKAAEAAAREAGRLASNYLADPSSLVAVLKGPQDVVTAADIVVEEMIVRSLRSSFRSDGFIGEEGGGVAADACWVIDPIDGTANFRPRTAALVRVDCVRRVGTHGDRRGFTIRTPICFTRRGVGKVRGATARRSG
jgi:hypothetical protein